MRFWWDIVIILLATFNSFAIPFLIAFEPVVRLDIFTRLCATALVFDVQSANSVSYKVFDYLVAVVFVSDMLINFRTTFVITRTGDEIWDQKMIAKRYLFGGRFIIDILSAFPLEELGVTPNPSNRFIERCRRQCGHPGPVRHAEDRTRVPHLAHHPEPQRATRHKVGRSVASNLSSY